MPDHDLGTLKPRERVKEQVAAWIREQGLGPGDRIASQVQIAQMLDTTAATVHNALTELVADGTLHRRRGVGTFVGPEQAEAKAVREMCLVLPEAHLEDPSHNPDFWPNVQTLLRGFMKAGGRDWSLTTRAVPPDADPQALAEQFGRYDAVFFHFDRPPRDLMQHLIDSGMAPVIKLGQPKRGLACLTIDHDRRESVRRAIRWLFEQGHRRIGFIDSEQYYGDWALAGYEQAHADFGLEVDPQRIVRTGDERQEGFRGAALVAGRGPGGRIDCDAVFVGADHRALAALEYFRQQGIEVPRDLSVMGYDGTDLAVHHPPYLATVKIPYGEMVAEALRRVEAAGGKPLAREHVGLVAPVVKGATVSGGEASSERSIS